MYISVIFCSLKDIFHERAWIKSSIFNVQVATTLIMFNFFLHFSRFRDVQSTISFDPLCSSTGEVCGRNEGSRTCTTTGEDVESLLCERPLRPGSTSQLTRDAKQHWRDSLLFASALYTVHTLPPA